MQNVTTPQPAESQNFTALTVEIRKSN